MNRQANRERPFPFLGFLPWFAAIAVPVFYLIFYTPYGMDTTDFGYFYAYAWRILEGQFPYWDFFYIKPAFPLYWHAFWLWLTTYKFQVLAGKAGFCVTLLLASWLSALYLSRLFSLARKNLPMLATCGFVFSIHSFPHMPWHTADGVLFCAAALFCAVSSMPWLAGITCGFAMLCKQSFALMPIAIILILWYWQPKKQLLYFCLSCLGILALWGAWLLYYNAWNQFRAMTTGQLDLHEAIDAGILIYLRQNWLMPALSCLPAGIALLLKRRLIWPLQPAYLYLLVLTFWYIWEIYSRQTWLGFGASWPTLWLLLGCAEALCARRMLLPFLRPGAGNAAPAAFFGLAGPLLAAWSTAISGGYKIPAMFATPLVFAFLLPHTLFFGNARRLLWLTLAAGLVMFWAGYQFPYVFPERPLKRNSLVLDAGDIYPQATGVKVDADMYERLRELKALRHKYGSNYKTLPGFSFAYYLNGDRPVIGSDWLIDWEINGQTDDLYNQLMEKNVTVFMERDQLDAQKADAYDRAGYSVPQMVRKNWRKIDETPHFVVFQKPGA